MLKCRSAYSLDFLHGGLEVIQRNSWKVHGSRHVANATHDGGVRLEVFGELRACRVHVPAGSGLGHQPVHERVIKPLHARRRLQDFGEKRFHTENLPRK
jgi:hypothetical protein